MSFKRTPVTRSRKKTLKNDYYLKRYVASNSATLLVSAAGSLIAGALIGLLCGSKLWVCMLAALAACFISELAHFRGRFRR